MSTGLPDPLFIPTAVTIGTQHYTVALSSSRAQKRFGNHYWKTAAWGMTGSAYFS